MAERVAVRCDGGAGIGAGHVARCLPIAAALRERGTDARLVGSFDGLAAWLVERSGVPAEPPGGAPLGVVPDAWSGAVVDLYLDDSADVCTLAGRLPVATVGEATRCPDAGLWIDYHAGSSPGADARRLGGPAYVPLDPRFAQAAAPIRDELRRIIVLAGGSAALAPVAGRIAGALATSLPDATIAAPAMIARAAGAHVDALDEPVDVLTAAAAADLAVVGAGMTLYELAAAGVPCVAVALVDNQPVVVAGCRSTGLAVAVDGVERDPVPGVLAAAERLAAPEARRALAARARDLLDGRGAERIADALIAAWTRG